MFPDLISKKFDQAFDRPDGAGREGAVGTPQVLAHALKHGDVFLPALPIFDPFQKVPNIGQSFATGRAPPAGFPGKKIN